MGKEERGEGTGRRVVALGQRLADVDGQWTEADRNGSGGWGGGGGEGTGRREWLVWTGSGRREKQGRTVSSSTGLSGLLDTMRRRKSVGL